MRRPDLAWLTARPIAHRGYHDAASGRIENPDIADVYNNVLKVAKKRAAKKARANSSSAGRTP